MPVRNMNDGSKREPFLRVDMNMYTLWELPDWSTVPRGDDTVVHLAIKSLGFGGVQGGNLEVCKAIGLPITTNGRVDKVGDADRLAGEAKKQGYDCMTLHVGTGFESDSGIDALVGDIISASEEHDFPLYIEIHRATITQDIWRAIQFTERNPGVRFNGDFSHWYTGLEMVYGDIVAKWDFMAPVFDRTCYMHGRIGNSGCIQVDIGDGHGRIYVDHFREMWTRSFAGFLKTAAPGDFIGFAPEILGPMYNYARLFRNQAGELVEESDRWAQALVYKTIAEECFAEARNR